MRILLICNTSDSVIGFRKKLIEKMQENGHQVCAIAFDDKCREKIIEKNIDFYSLEDKNRSLNPLKILSLERRYKKLIKKINPNLVFTFQLKPNIFGVPAAKACGIKNIYSMVEGAGDVFINNTFKWKIIRFVVCKLYRRAFKFAKKVFFLNNDDKAEFLERKLVRENQCEIVHGIGVDLDWFSYKPVKNYKTFLMIARMLKTKGVFEYCKAARLVKQKYPDAVFNYLGGEGTVKLADIQEYIDDGSINYLGTTTDVRPYIEDCIVHILPSYREGLGLVNAEAGASGRLSITCDTVGTRDTVKDGYNGFLVPIKNAEIIAEKCIWAIENSEEAEGMGKNARKFAEENFDQKKINEKILNIIEG